ncbi:MAG: AMP-binding protein [Gammaproteobacteria bacterium]|nr:AMP-binding protein [Gammaproteobacteria bacterium]
MGNPNSPGNAPSYVCGTSEQPLLYRTVGQLLDDARAQWPERLALVSRHQKIRLTYSELGARVDAFAAGLVALGLKPGDRIGIWSPNTLEWVITQFATAKAGLILVNINPAYRLAELEYALNKVECTALVTASTFKSSDYLGMLRTLAPELAHCAPGALTADKLPHLRTLIALDEAPQPGMYRFVDIPSLGGAAEQAELVRLAGLLQPDDPINIQFTSGTTGMPKGATLTHFNIVNNGYFVGQAMHFTAGDRLCIPVPLYHCFGMVMGVLTCVSHGAAMIFPSDAFEPKAVLEAVAAERCTALHGVPTMFIAELDHPEFSRYDLGSLRTGIMAGAPCPIEVMKRVLNEMHMSGVTIAYGMTETSPVSFQSKPDDPLERRVSTIGRIHPHVQVRIVDAEGRTVPRGEKGELCTRGYSVMQGYWNDEERTREAIDAAGWMHTGDLAVIDDEGYCNIVGRVKDMIIRGGENVYPREIEEFLFRHPKIQDVAVFGVPDARFGEQIAAWVRLREGETAEAEEIRAFCQGQIAHYKIPHYVRFVQEFPMTVTGKIQKFMMRDAMVESLQLDVQKTA